MKFNFEGSEEEFKSVTGGAMLQVIQQLYAMQRHSQPSAFSEVGSNQGHYQQPQPLRSVHLPALPPPSSYSQPVNFAHPQSHSAPQTVEYTVHPQHQPTAQPTHQPAHHYQELVRHTAPQSIPQPFVPTTQTTAAIVPFQPAEIVPTTQPQVKAAGLLAGWLRSLSQSKGAMLVVCALVFAGSMWLATKLPITSARSSDWDKGVMPAQSSPVPTIQAQPKQSPKPAAKPAANSSAQSVVPVPCLPLPVTQKGC